MEKALQMMLTSTKSNDVPVIFLWKIAHVLSAILWWWYYLRHLCLDDVIKLLYSPYAFIALSFDILHLWLQNMCGKWILAHICYAFGFAPKTGCDIYPLSQKKNRATPRILIWQDALFTNLLGRDAPFVMMPHVASSSPQNRTTEFWAPNLMTPANYHTRWFWSWTTETSRVAYSIRVPHILYMCPHWSTTTLATWSHDLLCHVLAPINVPRYQPPWLVTTLFQSIDQDSALVRCYS
jgi:hypothetical protein